ncbi:hypothetical protein M2R47_09075 [Moraxella sp. Tifton1]|uniref:Uncharacterized protein n=1 Tax=Moraxella oculi TaxID=2940516 RepID=A0ABW8U8I9_9GAMM|nr:hypothetical protein [Moraxella sp. Tifton1]MCL1624378.1 hypothetical protein [Moraxella sp. Tifton1]
MRYDHLINYHDLIDASYGGHIGYLYDNIRQNIENLHNLKTDKSFVIDILLDVVKYVLNKDIIELHFMADIRDKTVDELNSTNIDEKLKYIKESILENINEHGDILYDLDGLWWDVYAPFYVIWHSLN